MPRASRSLIQPLVLALAAAATGACAHGPAPAAAPTPGADTAAARRPAARAAATPAKPWRPGYFQQHIAYRMEAVLDDRAEVLHGRARLRYTNNSANALDSVYFHLYLNAFRPNSAWARRELEFGIRRFQDLSPEDQAFDHLHFMRFEGRPLTPLYPGAPDSTVVGFALPRAIQPGATVTFDMGWDARPSTLPRRQGRRGRHYDFAQWFPKVAVYDQRGWEPHALMPQGEFYGEFGTYDVTMDLAADQVVGATGVPIEGDPGWAAVAASGFADSLFYGRDVYGAAPAAEALGLIEGAPAAGRRRIRWLAKMVHNFAWSTAPDYTYEGGHLGKVAIHVLYEPGDTAWHEAALENTRTALAWLERIYGPFAWPQITSLHRIEGGGTEFPMVIMLGGPGLGLIIHELGHNYTMGILANNEWREGYLDEGFTSFQTAWYFQTHGNPDIWDRSFAGVASLDSAGVSQPLDLESAQFRDFRTYNLMTYTKPSVVYRMLQAYLGDDVMARGLRAYYAENELTHVTLADFQHAMEEASGQKLDWFFDEWFHTTDTLDYAVAGATTAEQPDGSWKTTVEVTRAGEAWMPVTLQVGSVRKRLDSHDRSQTVEVVTPTRPSEVVLDPDTVIVDVVRSNNIRKL